MCLTTLQKRTIVRFLGPRLGALPALGLALAGCAGSSALLTAPRACAVGEATVCSRFGPATECACAPAPELQQFLAGFGEAAWTGGRH